MGSPMEVFEHMSPDHILFSRSLPQKLRVEVLKGHGRTVRSRSPDEVLHFVVEGLALLVVQAALRGICGDQCQHPTSNLYSERGQPV